MFNFQNYPEIRYFSFKELIKTDTGLPNVPDSFYYVCNLLKLAEVLDLMREYIDAPIIVNSAYRSLAVNAAVGGVDNSFHLYGLAADITSWKWNELLKCVNEFKLLGYFEEVIVYEEKHFIHIAIKD